MSETTTLAKKPSLRIRGNHPADKFPRTEFNSWVRECCETSRKVESMKSLDSCRLTAKGLLKECIENAGSTAAKIKSLRFLIDRGTGLEDCQRSVNRSVTFLQSRRWSQAPKDYRSLNWLFTDQSRSELAAKGYQQYEAFCVAVVRASETYPEIFGEVESSEDYNRQFAELQARQNELMEKINKGYGADDLIISDLDRAGRGTVSFKLGPEVLVVPGHDAAQRLVEALCGKGW